MPTLEEIEEEQRQSLLGLLNRTDTPALPVNKNNMTEVIEPDSQRKVSMPAGSSMGMAKETLKLQDAPQATADDWRNADGLINQFSSFLHKPGGLGDPLDIPRAFKNSVAMNFMETASSELMRSADRIEFYKDIASDSDKAVDEADGIFEKAESLFYSWANDAGDVGVPVFSFARATTPYLHSKNIHGKLRAYNESIDKSIAQYIIDNDLDDPEERTIAEGAGDTIFSLAKFLIISAAQPLGPLGAGGVFGREQFLDGYKERRSQGMSVYDSTNGAIPEGVITTIASTIGGGMVEKVFKGGTKTVLGGIFLAGGSEFLDEASESALIDIVRNHQGVQDKPKEEIARDSMTGGFFGFLGGGTTGGAGKYNSDRKIKNALGRADVQENLAQQVNEKILADNAIKIQSQLAEDLDAMTDEEVMAEIQAEVDSSGPMPLSEDNAESIASQIEQYYSTQQEVVDDSNLSEPQTEPGRKLKEARQTTLDVVASFLKGEKIGNVYKTKKQQDQAINDIMAKMGTVSERVSRFAAQSELRNLRTELSDVLGELDTLEKEGDVALEEHADTFKTKKAREAYEGTTRGGKLTNEGKVRRSLVRSSDTEIKSLKEKKAKIQAEIKALTETGRSKKARKKQEEVRLLDVAIDNERKRNKELQKKVENIEAKLKDDYNDFFYGTPEREGYLPDTFQDSFDKTTEAQRISDRTAEINLRILEIADQQVALAEKAGLPELAEFLKGQRINVTMENLISLESRAALKAFKEGMAIGKHISDTQKDNIINILTEMVNAMPISDKQKGKLKDKFVKTSNAKELGRAVDKILTQGMKIAMKEKRAEIWKDINVMIGKEKPSLEQGVLKGKIRYVDGEPQASDPDVNDMLIAMGKMTNETAMDQALANIEENDLTAHSEMMLRYANIKANGSKTDPFLVAKFADDLEFMIVNGYLPTETEIANAKQKKATEEKIRNLSDKPASEMNDVDLVYTNEKLVDRLKFFVFDSMSGNFFKTYDTFLSSIGLADDKTFSMAEEQLEMNARNRYWESRKRDAMAAAGMTAEDIKNWDSRKSIIDKDSDIPLYWTVGKQNIIDIVNEIGENGFSEALGRKEKTDDKGKLKDAKDFVMRYFSNSDTNPFMSQPELMDRAEAAESIDELIDIVNESKAEDIKRDLAMNKGQLAHRVMALRNGQTRQQAMDPLGPMGYTQGLIDNLNNNMLERENKFLDEIAKLNEEVYEALAPVYRDRFKVSMPKVDNYIYTPYESEAKAKDNAGLFSTSGTMGDLLPGALKKRSRHKKELKLVNLLDVTDKYLSDIQWFISMSGKIDSIDAILKNPEMRKILKHKMGVTNLRKLNQHIDKARHTINDGNDLVDSTLSKMLGLMSNTALAFKPQVGFKQLTSTFSLMEVMPVDTFLAGLATAPANMKRWREDARKHPAILHRGEHKDIEYQVDTGKRKRSDYGVKSKFGAMQDVSMLGGKLGDITAVYTVMGIYTDHLVNDLGMSRDEARNKAVLFVESSQQTTIGSNRTLAQQGNPLARATTMFTTGPVALFNRMLKAHYKFKQSGKTANDYKEYTKALATYMVIIPNAFAWISSGFDGFGEDDEEKIKNMIAKNSLGGVFFGLPVYGSIAEYFASEAAEMLTGNEIRNYGLGEMGINPYKEIGQKIMSDKDKMVEEMLGIADGDSPDWFVIMESMAGITGDVTGTGLRNVTQLTKGSAGLISEDRETDDLMRFLGWSDGAIKETHKRNKKKKSSRKTTGY